MILCAGECLIDMLPADGAFVPKAGGAVYNTALALGRLGCPTAYLWPISRDHFGQDLLLPPLERANVDTSICPRTKRPTTLAFVELSNGQATYRFYDEGSAGRLFSTDDLPAALNADLLFIGGISLVPDPCGATLETLVDLAVQAGIPVMLDPNIRPFFIQDSAAYEARLLRLLRKATIVKLSEYEVEWLRRLPGFDLNPVAAILKSANLVVVTKGETGAEAYWAEHTHRIAGEKIAVVDTIGAGDSFNAGVIAALHRGGVLPARLQSLNSQTVQDALSLGNAVAAVTVSREGADPPWAKELDQASLSGPFSA